MRNIILNKFKQATTGPADRPPARAGSRRRERAQPAPSNSSTTTTPTTTTARHARARLKWDKNDEGPRQPTTSKRAPDRLRSAAAVKGVRITKTYSLTEGEYHLGLEVRREARGRRRGAGQVPLSAGRRRGLPVEGKWYTSVFRNALIARVEKNSVDPRHSGPAADQHLARRQAHRQGKGSSSATPPWPCSISPR